MAQYDSEKLNDMDFELLLAKRMVQNSFFGDYRGENIEWPDVFVCFNSLDIDEIFNDFNERLKIYEDEFGTWHYILEKDESD